MVEIGNSFGFLARRKTTIPVVLLLFGWLSACQPGPLEKYMQKQEILLELLQKSPDGETAAIALETFAREHQKEMGKLARDSRQVSQEKPEKWKEQRTLTRKNWKKIDRIARKFQNSTRFQQALERVMHGQLLKGSQEQKSQN